MGENDVNFVINISGNAGTTLQKVSQNMTVLTAKAQNTLNVFSSFSGKMIAFNQMSEVFSKISNSLFSVSESGMNFEQSIADLSSITGIAGTDLETLTQKSREFGISSGLGASQVAESYKILASQIDVTKIGMSGLNELQKNSIILSKASGLQMGESANAMAGTINQFGLAATDASRVINVLAAGSKWGAAEIPELAQSFKVVGSAASSAGLNIEQTAGAIEVLSKNNLKGAEAGTAFRNILLKMQTELKVDFSKTSLSDALTSLQPKMKNATYLSKLFGMENVSAAQFLIKNADAVKEMTDRVTDTNVASEQAAIRTQTYAEKLAVIKAKMDDFKLGVFQATGSLLPFAQIASQSLAPFIPLFPLLSNLKGMFKSTILMGISLARGFKLQWLLMGRSINSASMASLGFGKNILRASVSVIRFGTVGILSAIKGMGALVLSFITGGTASATFASISSASFLAFRTSAQVACKSVGVAIMSIPIIGWIAAIVAALIALIVKFREIGASWTQIIVSFILGPIGWIATYFYLTNDKVRAVMDGMIEAVKEIFSGMGEFLSEVFEGIWHMIKGVFNPANWFDDSFHISDGLDRIKNAAMSYGKAVGDGYRLGKNRSLNESAIKGFDAKNGTKEEAWAAAKKRGMNPAVFEEVWKKVEIQRKENQTSQTTETQIPGNPKVSPSFNKTTPSKAADAITGGGKNVKQIYINIDSLIKSNTNQFTQGQSPKDATSFMEQLTNALQMIVNDTNYAY